MLDPIRDSIDDLPEVLKGEYEQHDGKYHLLVKLDEKSPWRPVAGLTSALASERTQRSAAVTQRETFKQERETLKQERERLQAQLAEAEARLTKPGDDVTKTPAFEQFKTAQENRVKALEDALSAANAKTMKAEQEAAETRFLDEVRREAAPFVRDEPGVLEDFVERRVRPHFKCKEEGKFYAFDGQSEMFSLKNPGQLMPIKEFITEIAIKAPEAAYQLRPNRGANVPGNNGIRPGPGTFTVRKGAPHDEYVRVRDAAEKAGQQLVVIE